MAKRIEWGGTPGPWVAWDDGRGIGIDDGHGEPIQIAEIVDGADLASEAQLAADQRAIAKVPEMVAALRRVIAWDDAGCDPSRKSLDAIRALLAAIDGEG